MTVVFGPFENILLAHNVRVDEQVAVAHAEVLLTGGALGALQVVHLVAYTHGHLKRPDPFLAGCAQAVLTEKPLGIKERYVYLVCERETLHSQHFRMIFRFLNYT